MYAPVQKVGKSGLELRRLPEPRLYTGRPSTPTSTDSESIPPNPKNPVLRNRVDSRVDPDSPPKSRVVNEHASSKLNHDASLVVSYLGLQTPGLPKNGGCLLLPVLYINPACPVRYGLRFALLCRGHMPHTSAYTRVYESVCPVGVRVPGGVWRHVQRGDNSPITCPGVSTPPTKPSWVRRTPRLAQRAIAGGASLHVFA